MRQTTTPDLRAWRTQRLQGEAVAAAEAKYSPAPLIAALAAGLG